MDAQNEFDDAVKYIHRLPGEKETTFQPPISLKLKFYSLYKQATEGKCNVPAPPFYSVIARTKWGAWNRLGDLSKEEAMREYARLFRECQEKYKEIAPKM